MRQCFEFLAAFVLLGLPRKSCGGAGANSRWISKWCYRVSRAPRKKCGSRCDLESLNADETRISTRDGVLAGSVAPFGSRAAQEGSVYTVPLPQTAVTGGRICLRLEIVEPGKSPRPPEAGEVESIEPIYEAVGN